LGVGNQTFYYGMSNGQPFTGIGNRVGNQNVYQGTYGGHPYTGTGYTIGNHGNRISNSQYASPWGAQSNAQYGFPTYWNRPRR
jgi:hypothetical protein